MELVPIRRRVHLRLCWTLQMTDREVIVTKSSSINNNNNGSDDNNSSNNSIGRSPTFITEKQHKRLEELKIIRVKSNQLERLKQQVVHATQTIRDEDTLIAEYETERQALLKEKEAKMMELRMIQKDLTMVEDLIASAQQDKQKQVQQLNRMYNNTFTKLKDQVDEMRVGVGLNRLPSLQEQQERDMAQYLQKRLRDWKEGNKILKAESTQGNKRTRH